MTLKVYEFLCRTGAPAIPSTHDRTEVSKEVEGTLEGHCRERRGALPSTPLLSFLAHHVGDLVGNGDTAVVRGPTASPRTGRGQMTTLCACGHRWARGYTLGRSLALDPDDTIPRKLTHVVDLTGG
jgi:hypothetical protein